LACTPTLVTVQCTGAKSSNAINYRWDWGDGSIDSIGETATHVYVLPGAYTITLTVTSASGETDSAQKVVTVPS